MRGFTVRGTSCPSDRQRVRRRARQEAIEMAQGDALGQAIVDESRSALDGYVQEGAWRMLQRALEYEVENFLAEHALRADNKGRKQVVHNGYLPARTIMTGELIPWLYLKGISTGDLPPFNGTTSRERIWVWSKPKEATNATRKGGTG